MLSTSRAVLEPSPLAQAPRALSTASRLAQPSAGQTTLPSRPRVPRCAASSAAPWACSLEAALSHTSVRVCPAPHLRPAIAQIATRCWIPTIPVASWSSLTHTRGTYTELPTTRPVLPVAVLSRRTAPRRRCSALAPSSLVALLARTALSVSTPLRSSVGLLCNGLS